MKRFVINRLLTEKTCLGNSPLGRLLIEKAQLGSFPLSRLPVEKTDGLCRLGFRRKRSAQVQILKCSRGLGLGSGFLPSNLVSLLFRYRPLPGRLSWRFHWPKVCAGQIILPRRTANNNLEPIRVHSLLDPTGLSAKEIKNDAHRLGLELGHPDLFDPLRIPKIPALYLLA